MNIEELEMLVEGAANFLRGMSLDRHLDETIRDAVLVKANELDAALEKHLEEPPNA